MARPGTLAAVDVVVGGLVRAPGLHGVVEEIAREQQRLVTAKEATALVDRARLALEQCS